MLCYYIPPCQLDGTWISNPKYLVLKSCQVQVYCTFILSLEPQRHDLPQDQQLQPWAKWCVYHIMVILSHNSLHTAKLNIPIGSIEVFFRACDYLVGSRAIPIAWGKNVWTRRREALSSLSVVVQPPHSLSLPWISFDRKYKSMFLNKIWNIWGCRFCSR